jgi:hypothetical protein
MLHRFGVGVSATGGMSGPTTAVSNAVICSPGDGTIGQYQLLNTSFTGIVPENAPGVTSLSFLQANGQTIMTWSRNVNNGNPNDQQISLTGPTWVIWAVGTSNTFSNVYPSTSMSSAAVSFVPAPAYQYTSTLTTGLVLNWNVVGSRLDFQAVYNGTAW